MLQLSKKKLNFEPSFANSIRLHRRERLSFDPLENLQNSLCTGEKSESRCKPKAEWSYSNYSKAKPCLSKVASSAVAYILLTPLWSWLTYILAGMS